jgi:hypothetical protein
MWTLCTVPVAESRNHPSETGGSWQPQRGYESRYSESSQIPDNTENSGERSGILQTDETADFPRGMQQTVLL